MGKPQPLSGIRLALALAFLGLVGLVAALLFVGRPTPTVIVISLDGTTPKDVNTPELATLTALAQRGAVARKLVPVFPTNDFPNHATLATGVAPEVHGIVGFEFLGSEGLFRYSSDPTWFQAEPIWSIADRHDVVSAAFHWIGSEGPWIHGRGARYWKPWNAEIDEATKVAQILEWLDVEDPKARPRLITSWFRGADATGHQYGPGSEEVLVALRLQDEALGRLVAGLDARGAFEHTTLLLVSDHGILPVQEQVDLAQAFETRGLRVRTFGEGGSVRLSAAEPDLDRALEVAESLGLEAYRRNGAPADLPAAVRLDNPRFGDAVVLAPPGIAIGSSDPDAPVTRGAHGYLPDVPEMSGFFMAVGRGITPGTQLPDVSAVDVAPTVLTLLGIPVPRAMEGRPIAGVARPAGDAQ